MFLDTTFLIDFLRGKKIGEVDCLIAAVALSNGIEEIVTENRTHFERISNVKVLSY